MSEIESVAAECNPGARQHSARPMPYSALHPLPSDEGFLNKSLLDQLDAQADAEPVESTASDDSDHSSPHVPYHQPQHTHDPDLFSGNPTLSIPSGPNALPPRKQIIGFAKFRTREEALGLLPAEPPPPAKPRTSARSPCPVPRNARVARRACVLSRVRTDSFVTVSAFPRVTRLCDRHPEHNAWARRTRGAFSFIVQRCVLIPISATRSSSSPLQTARSSAAHSNRLRAPPFLDPTRCASALRRTDECECDSARSRCPGAGTSPLTSHVRRLATPRPSH
ncbi:hypothetical protein C8R43DRAFT_1036118 [Mycena crocata]|nr:hypothetical protein C8R43DRAFT_1036118 [Mycena crocata]